MAKQSVILTPQHSSASTVAVGVLCLLGLVQLATLAHTGWQSWRGIRPIPAAPVVTAAPPQASKQPGPAVPWTVPKSNHPAPSSQSGVFDSGSLPPLPTLNGVRPPIATPSAGSSVDSLPPLPKLPVETESSPPPAPTRLPTTLPRTASSVMALPTPAPALTKPATPRPSTGDAQVDELIEVAMLSREANDNEGALKALERADLILPDNAAVIRQKALTFSKMGQIEKANALMDRAAKLGPVVASALPSAPSAPSGGGSDNLGGAFGGATPSGPLTFGQSIVSRDPSDTTGEKVIVKFLVKSAPGASINANDMNLDVFFFDKVDGMRPEATKSDPPVYAFDLPVDFKTGEEVVTVIYHMPRLTEKEVAEFGQRAFHGYFAKLYYQGRLMDSTAAPRELLNPNDGSAQAANPLLPAPPR